MRTKTLYMHKQGPLLEYSEGALIVQNCNPWVETRWRFSRADMLCLAWRSFLTAIS